MTKSTFSISPQRLRNYSIGILVFICLLFALDYLSYHRKMSNYVATHIRISESTEFQKLKDIFEEGMKLDSLTIQKIHKQEAAIYPLLSNYRHRYNAGGVIIKEADVFTQITSKFRNGQTGAARRALNPTKMQLKGIKLIEGGDFEAEKLYMLHDRKTNYFTYCLLITDQKNKLVVLTFGN